MVSFCGNPRLSKDYQEKSRILSHLCNMDFELFCCFISDRCCSPETLRILLIYNLELQSPMGVPVVFTLMMICFVASSLV